jgi:hypothetical protein
MTPYAFDSEVPPLKIRCSAKGVLNRISRDQTTQMSSSKR